MKSDIFGHEDKQQSRLPVTQEIAGSAPVLTVPTIRTDDKVSDNRF